MLGLISGAVAGLVAMTAGLWLHPPWHGAVIGVVAGTVCFFASTEIKRMLGYDDSLDVFGVHGVGGILGTMLTGVFAAAAVSIDADNPAGLPGLLEGNAKQVLVQFYGVAVTVLWCGAVTFVLLKLISLFSPLRVAERCEVEGLDISQHGKSIHS